MRILKKSACAPHRMGLTAEFITKNSTRFSTGPISTSAASITIVGCRRLSFGQGEIENSLWIGSDQDAIVLHKNRSRLDAHTIFRGSSIGGAAIAVFIEMHKLVADGDPEFLRDWIGAQCANRGFCGGGRGALLDGNGGPALGLGLRWEVRHRQRGLIRGVTETVVPAEHEVRQIAEDKVDMSHEVAINPTRTQRLILAGAGR